MKIASTTSSPFAASQPAPKVELSSPMPQARTEARPSKPLAPSAAAEPQFVTSRPVQAPATYSVHASRPIPNANDHRVSLPPFAAQHEARIVYGMSARFKLPS